MSKKLNQRILNAGFAFVLALSSVATLGSQVASATTAPLSAGVTCVDEKAVLTLTGRQADMPDVPANAVNWNVWIKYNTVGYGSTTQTLSYNDVDTWTIPTNQMVISGNPVSADVFGTYTTPETIYFFGIPIGSYQLAHVYNKHLTSSYEAENCDATAPDAPVVTATGVADGATTNVSPVTINWTKPSEDTATYDYRVWTDAAGSAYNSMATAYEEDGLTGNSRTGAFSEGDGSYFVQVRAIDTANNPSDWSDVFTVIYDKTAPALTLNTIATNSDTSRAITGTSEKDAEVTATVDGTSQVTTADVNGDWSITVSGLALGAHTVSATSKDAVGNVSATVTGEFTVTVVPVAPEVTTPQSSGSTNQGQPLAFSSVFTADDSQAANADGSEVAGAATEKDQKVLGEETSAVKNDGLAWYWWVLIAAAVAAFAWWLVAFIRRRQADNA